MKTVRWNGENWYVDNRPLFKRIRQWFIWIGGWESSKKGQPWRFSIEGAGRRIWLSPAPVSLFGHRFTWYSWGANLKLPSGWLVWAWREGRCYISKNGTPGKAHHWFWGLPLDELLEMECRYGCRRDGNFEKFAVHPECELHLLLPEQMRQKSHESRES